MRVLLLIAVVGCGGSASDGGPPRSPPGTGEAYSSIAPSPEVDALAADFRGSCAFARPPGDAIDYQARIGARGRDPQAIAVRANPYFDPNDRDNVIGELPSGKRVAAAGPIAPGGENGGLGYAVLVRDSEGRVCRGYVSAAEVDVLSFP